MGDPFGRREAGRSQGISPSPALPWAVSSAAVISVPGMPYLLWPLLLPGSHWDDLTPAQFFQSLSSPTISPVERMAAVSCCCQFLGHLFISCLAF